MKTLILLRHAKSSWKDLSLRDFDRPLNKRGKRDAPFMAQKFKEKGYQPELILASPALRTKLTAEAFKQALGTTWAGSLKYESRIYEGHDHTLLELIKRQPDEVQAEIHLTYGYAFKRSKLNKQTMLHPKYDLRYQDSFA